MLLHRERARTYMEERGLDVLVTASPANVAYAADLPNDYAFQLGARALAVVPRREQPVTLVIDLKRVNDLAWYENWNGRLFTFGRSQYRSTAVEPSTSVLRRLRELLAQAEAHSHPSWTAATRAALDAAGARRVGCEGEGLGRALAAEGFAGEIVEAGDAFPHIRRVKTVAEIDRLRESARINELGERAALDALGEGVLLTDVERRFAATVGAEGGVPRMFVTSAGAHSVITFAAFPYTLRRGDVVRLDCSSDYGGYYSDTGRTAVIGPADGKLLAVFEALVRGMEAAQSALGPGVTCDAVARAGQMAVRRACPDYDQTYLGHAIGREQKENPPVAVGCDVVLEPGMVINLEFPYYEMGWAGLQLEETFCVTEHGCEPLNTTPRTIFEL